MIRFIILLSFFTILVSSCKKDPEPIAPVTTTTNPLPIDTIPTGSVKIEFDNMFDTLDLALDTVNFVLDNGDKMKVSIFKYYISNIKLTDADGNVFAEPESYHLIDESNAASQKFTISGVPYRNYTSITFMIGVDSARNVSGAQTDALDPGNNMFWTWSTGYIMAKLEGTSLQSTAPGNSIGFHIAGFKGVNSALKEVSPSFNGSTANVSATVIPEIHIKCNLKEWFINPTTMSLATTNNVTTVNSTSKMIADNYADMFTIKHINN